MGIGVFGSKNFPRRDWVASLIQLLPPATRVITTGMQGPSLWAEEECKLLGIECKPFLLTKKYSSNDEFYAAATARNKHLAPECDVAVVFWIGNDATCRNLINALAEAGVPVWIIPGDYAHILATKIIHQVIGLLQTRATFELIEKGSK